MAGYVAGLSLLWGEEKDRLAVQFEFSHWPIHKLSNGPAPSVGVHVEMTIPPDIHGVYEKYL